MKFSIWPLTLLAISFSAAAADWLSDSKAELCRQVSYDLKCKNCSDGWMEVLIIEKQTKKPIAIYSRSICERKKGEPCGDLFRILGSPERKVKCEEFVNEVQRRHKECGSCLASEFRASG